MRELKFKAKDFSGEWHYGHLTIVSKKVNPIDPGYYMPNRMGSLFAYPVRPETVGQGTGEIDTERKEVYEGDKIEISLGTKKITRKVFFEKGRFVIESLGAPGLLDPMPIGRLQFPFRVVGNIHD